MFAVGGGGAGSDMLEKEKCKNINVIIFIWNGDQAIIKLFNLSCRLWW